jgi:selenocysteine-specific elongation factor
VTKEEIKRGQVLVSADAFTVTNVFDASLRAAGHLDYIIKQRMPVKCHIGTAEVMGRIVFFDRNEWKEEEGEILCQIRLDEEVVTKRGDRFILRRPSPAETIGGGWVIDPLGQKYRFGEETVALLSRKMEGTPNERIAEALRLNPGMRPGDLARMISADEETVLNILEADDFIKISQSEYANRGTVEAAESDIEVKLHDFHLAFPMKKGLNKAELVQSLTGEYGKVLAEYAVENGIRDGKWKRDEQWIRSGSFVRELPKSWRKRAENMLDELKGDQLQVQHLDDYFARSGIPAELKADMIHFMTDVGLIQPLDEQFFYHSEIFWAAVKKLKEGTGKSFEVGEAKDILGLTRKYIIPFLEKLDELQLTVREENRRIWKQK